jgi:hypothetical protein
LVVIDLLVIGSSFDAASATRKSARGLDATASILGLRIHKVNQR